MKVLIVGGGIAGLTLAAFLEESSVEYDIVEKCPDWAHQGFIIGLWDNGRDILQKLRLAEAMDKAGERVLRYSVRDGRGNTLRDFNLGEFYSEFGGAATIIGRKELHELLLSKVDTSRIRMKTSVESLDRIVSRIVVTFSDKTQADYDVVVGADGVHSKVRELEFGSDIESFTDWRAWYLWIDNSFNVPASIVEYIEPREFVVTFAAGGKTLACFISPADHRVWDTQEGRVNRLKSLFRDETHIVPAALENKKDEDALPTDLVDINMRHFVKRGIALVGDAAHSFGPMAGLGSSIAMEDAYTLAAELMQVSPTYSVQEALLTYEKHRKKRITIARDVTQRLRLAALIPNTFMGWIIKKLAPYVPASYLTNDYKKLLREEI